MGLLGESQTTRTIYIPAAGVHLRAQGYHRALSSTAGTVVCASKIVSIRAYQRVAQAHEKTRTHLFSEYNTFGGHGTGF
jgi:hypothetical protein